MVRFLILAATTTAVVLPSGVTAQSNWGRGDVFSIRATTGGYYLRTISPKGDTLDASCQLIDKGAWTFRVTVHPSRQVTTKSTRPATLTLSGKWNYPLRDSGSNDFHWNTKNADAFALFLNRVNGMGWGDRFVSRVLGVSFLSHGSNDPGTISAFEHLCRLPGTGPNAY